MPTRQVEPFDLGVFLADIREKEAAGVFTPEGRVLSWTSVSSERTQEEQERIIPLAKAFSDVAQAAGLPAVERVWIDGVRRKIMLLRTPKRGFILTLIGAAAMNIGLAWLNLKGISTAVEEAFKDEK